MQLHLPMRSKKYLVTAGLILIIGIFQVFTCSAADTTFHYQFNTESVENIQSGYNSNSNNLQQDTVDSYQSNSKTENIMISTDVKSDTSTNNDELSKAGDTSFPFVISTIAMISLAGLGLTVVLAKELSDK